MGIWFALVLSLVLGIILGVGTFFLHRSHRKPLPADCSLMAGPPSARTCLLLWPGCWLAVKSRNLFRVQIALGLHHSRSCSWLKGLAGEEPLFIAPLVKGWILVIGSGLPDPCEDADAAYRFILNLSRKVGPVQCFSASQLLHHHAWVKAKRGRVVRAYAWAGTTLWNQGPPTRAEKQLGLTCYGYTEPASDAAFGLPPGVEANVNQVLRLAARWGCDPSRVSQHLLKAEYGIAGELAHR